MNAAQAERRVRELAGAAHLPEGFDAWPGLLARLPRVRHRRRVMRAATIAMASVAVAAAVAVPLSASSPASAAAVAQRAASVARTGGGLPSFEMTVVTTTNPGGFQPEPPPPVITEHVDYAGPSLWRDRSLATEPFKEGTRLVTQIRAGAKVATVAAGQVTVTRATGLEQLPSSSAMAWEHGALRKLEAAGSSGRCAPSVSVSGNGPLVDGRETIVLHVGASPCPSADVPQSDGPATFWLDKQTFLILRAVLHGPGNRLAETINVIDLHYHVAFPAGTFRLPRPTQVTARCPTVTSLPDVAALRRALAYPPLMPARLPDGLRAGAIGSTGATGSTGTAASGCKITTFTITYDDASGRPAVQLYEALATSPSVRFPGRALTIRPGLTGTLNTGSGMAILWWIQDGRYCALQSGGVTAGVRLTGVPVAALVRIAASVRG